RAMTVIQSQSTSNPSAVAQVAAAAALTGPQECVAEMAREFDRRRDLVVARLRAIPGVQVTEPRRAFYAFPDVGEFLGRRGPDGPLATTGQLATYLLRSAGVAVVPGEGFGAPRNVRLSYAASIAVLEDGLSRMGRALTAL